MIFSRITLPELSDKGGICLYYIGHPPYFTVEMIVPAQKKCLTMSVLDC